MNSKDQLLVDDINLPQVLAAERDFIIVYKPPRMHSLPLPKPDATIHQETLLDFCIKSFPELSSLPGRRKGEGGLIHRLDYETQGLLLLGRSKKGIKSLLAQQEERQIHKYYSAITGTPPEGPGKLLPGFPPEKPDVTDVYSRAFISSAFRPYGEGRKAVRPLLDTNRKRKTGYALDRGAMYSTEILKSRKLAPGFALLELRLLKGFRHQIRSHLAWLDQPILNDSLYGGPAWGKGLLALRAFSLSFSDPTSGAALSYSIPCLELDMV